MKKIKKNEKLKPMKNRLVTPKIAQDIMPVDTFYAHNGVIKVGDNKYSVCGLHSNEKKEENVFIETKEEINKFKNLLDIASMKIQIFSKNTDDKKYDMFGNVVETSEEVKRRNIYIVLTIEVQTVDIAVEKLYNVMKKINEAMKIKVLSIEEYISVMYYFYNPGMEMKRGFFSDLFLKGLYLTNFFALGIPEFQSNYIETEEVYRSILFTRGLPEKIKENAISEIFELPFEVSTSIHIEPLDNEKIARFMEKQIKEIEDGRAINANFEPYRIDKDLEEAKKLYAIVTQGTQKLYNAGLYFSVVAGNEEELNERINKLYYICKKYYFNVEVVTVQTKEALATILPIGIDKVKVQRRLSNEYLAKLMDI